MHVDVMSGFEQTTIAACDNVSRIFQVRGENVLALDDVSMSVEVGTLVAIAGPSGSGKSTLLSILGCLDLPTSGSVRVGGYELTELSRRERRDLRRRLVATVLPQPSDNLLVARTGFENLSRAARHRGAVVENFDDIVASIELGGFAPRPAGTMSGGEQQRLALACALVGNTTLVLVDEPTGALDNENAGRVVDALVRAANSGATIVVATHDPTVMEAADVVVHLDHGRRMS